MSQKDFQYYKQKNKKPMIQLEIVWIGGKITNIVMLF